MPDRCDLWPAGVANAVPSPKSPAPCAVRPSGALDPAAPEELCGFRQCRIRSEEHTSELQSLMRISYAVFCLKKKTNTQNRTRMYHMIQLNNNISHESVYNPL